jgi:hypothetical protein
MTMPPSHLIGITLLLCLTLVGSALATDEPTVRQILATALAAQAGGARTTSRIRMTIKDAGGTRERTLSFRGKHDDDANKSVIFVEQPENLHNTSFLSVHYHDPGKSDEAWIYLPNLHRTSRVPPSGKAVAFVGSDFTLADLSPKHEADYDVKLTAASELADKEDCYRLELTARANAVKESTGYEHSELWISKSKGIVIRLKANLLGSSRIKYYSADQIRQVDGIWTPHRMQMRTVEGGKLVSETIIELLSVNHAASDVTDSDFTQQRLEHGF